MTATGAASTPAALDIFADLKPRTNTPGACAVSEMRKERPDLAEQYDRAMASARFGDRAIAEWVTDHGFHLGHQAVARHRRNECLGCRQTSSAT